MPDIMWKNQPYGRCRVLFAVSAFTIAAGCSNSGSQDLPAGGEQGGNTVDNSYAAFVQSQQSGGSDIAAVISQDASLAAALNQLQESAATPALGEALGEVEGEDQPIALRPSENLSSPDNLAPPEIESAESLQPSVIALLPSQTTSASGDGDPKSDTGNGPDITEADTAAESATQPELGSAESTPDLASTADQVAEQATVEVAESNTADTQEASSVVTPDVQDSVAPDTTTVTTAAASALPFVATVNDNELGNLFESTEFPGFTGEITDAGVALNWQAGPNIKGYNLYRNSQFLTTVFEPNFLDTDTPTTASNYYEAIAFDNNDNFSIGADGLTVKFRAEPAPKLPDHIAANYTLVFAEEFNSGALDPTVWNTSYLWGTDIIINQEEQYYVDVNNEPDFGYNPFVLDDETLTIRSIETPPELKDKALGQPYLSGVITSYDSFKFTYGYVEARVKLPRGRGFWSAFWLLNAYYVDRKPEIDIMEHIGHDPDLVFHTYHYFDEEGNLRSTESSGSSGVDYTEDYHVFSVEWKPGTAIFYVDGVERHRISDTKMSNQEMYIIANTAIGGWWPGSPDADTRFPGEYTIDYIRAWQKTTPFTDVLFDDGIDTAPLAPGNQERSPNHLPPFEFWPEGYPERQP